MDSNRLSDGGFAPVPTVNNQRRVELTATASKKGLVLAGSKDRAAPSSRPALMTSSISKTDSQQSLSSKRSAPTIDLPLPAQKIPRQDLTRPMLPIKSEAPSTSAAAMEEGQITDDAQLTDDDLPPPTLMSNPLSSSIRSHAHDNRSSQHPHDSSRPPPSSRGPASLDIQSERPMLRPGSPEHYVAERPGGNASPVSTPLPKRPMVLSFEPGTVGLRKPLSYDEDKFNSPPSAGILEARASLAECAKRANAKYALKAKSRPQLLLNYINRPDMQQKEDSFTMHQKEFELTQRGSTAQGLNAPNTQDIPGWSEIESWDLGEKLGEGTFGEVFKATKNDLPKEVFVLKRVIFHQRDAGVPITFIREVNLLQTLKHDNIITLSEVVTSKNADEPERLDFWMAFPYMDHDLNGLLENVTLDDTLCKLYAYQLCKGMHYLAVNKIVHRDIKTANLLINNNGLLRIADLGLTRPYTPTPDLPDILLKRNSDGDVVGNMTTCVVTRWYRPPELFLGSQMYGPEIDMWGVGCVIAEMFTRGPILPGSSDVNQLDLIWCLCGSPARQWPGWDKLPGLEDMHEPPSPGFSQIGKTFSKYGTLVSDLITHLLAIDPSKRLTASDALEHEWFWTLPAMAEINHVEVFPSSKEYDRRRTGQAPRVPRPVCPLPQHLRLRRREKNRKREDQKQPKNPYLQSVSQNVKKEPNQTIDENKPVISEGSGKVPPRGPSGLPQRPIFTSDQGEQDDVKSIYVKEDQEIKPKKEDAQETTAYDHQASNSVDTAGISHDPPHLEDSKVWSPAQTTSETPQVDVWEQAAPVMDATETEVQWQTNNNGSTPANTADDAWGLPSTSSAHSHEHSRSEDLRHTHHSSRPYFRGTSPFRRPYLIDFVDARLNEVVCLLPRGYTDSFNVSKDDIDEVVRMHSSNYKVYCGRKTTFASFENEADMHTCYQRLTRHRQVIHLNGQDFRIEYSRDNTSSRVGGPRHESRPPPHASSLFRYSGHR